MKILTILHERTASPSGLSLELDTPLGNVAYHVTELLKYECIELVYERPVRGTSEHFYRAIRRPYFHDADWTMLPLAIRQNLSGYVVQELVTDLAKSFAASAFDAREDRHLSRTPLVVDEQAWQEMNAMLNGMVERALEMQAQAAQRLRKAKASGFPAHLALVCFEPGHDNPEAISMASDSAV